MPTLEMPTFRGADLSGARLRNADLRGADLTGADLTNADMKYAKLNKADLKKAILNYADLRNINAIGAILEYADLTNAQLGGAKLIKAKLGGANLNQANLNGVTDLSGATLFNVKAENLTGCTEKLPTGWVCRGSSWDRYLSYNDPLEEEFFIFKKKNKNVKVYISSLPYQASCSAESKIIISQSNNGKYKVQSGDLKRYNGFDFKKAGKEFNRTYKSCRANPFLVI